MKRVVAIGLYGWDLDILDRARLAPLAAALPSEGAACLVCVERDPEACHRSLIADRLAANYGVAVSHLRP